MASPRKLTVPNGEPFCWTVITTLLKEESMATLPVEEIRDTVKLSCCSSLVVGRTIISIAPALQNKRDCHVCVVHFYTITYLCPLVKISVPRTELGEISDEGISFPGPVTFHVISELPTVPPIRVTTRRTIAGD